MLTARFGILSGPMNDPRLSPHGRGLYVRFGLTLSEIRTGAVIAYIRGKRVERVWYTDFVLLSDLEIWIVNELYFSETESRI